MPAKSESEKNASATSDAVERIAQVLELIAERLAALEGKLEDLTYEVQSIPANLAAELNGGYHEEEGEDEEMGIRVQIGGSGSCGSGGCSTGGCGSHD